MPNRHQKLDLFKLLVARMVVQEIDIWAIRAFSLANLDRWNKSGIWVTAHDEWRALMTSGTDESVIAAMTGLDQNANRLRQSPPYVGLISQESRVSLLKEAGLKAPSNRAIAAAERLLSEENSQRGG